MIRRQATWSSVLLAVSFGGHAPAFSAPDVAKPVGATSPPITAYAPGLTSDTDLLLLPRARRPAARPVVTAATRVKARADAVADVFLNPALLRQALPALVRADVVDTRPGPRPDGWPDRLIAWEVEVPLFNLTGKAWLQQQADGAEFTLVEGAFAPGRIRLRVAPAPSSAADVNAGSNPATTTFSTLTC
ncbi:MAG: hypothetical protein H7X95_04590, partial [Deltaproteobacteria bacterium]|nr:hypothetical protein [Deltaproteobacteria bacterium]